MTMKHLMMDIETLGVGKDALMIQLGACYFNPKTKEIGDTFLMSLDVLDSEKLGFKKSQSTLDWWKKQNKEVFDKIEAEQKPVQDVMKKFAEFIKPAKFYWSHTSFDFVIIQNYLEACSLRKMDFRATIDIRTINILSNINLDKYDWSGKTHDALDDCKFQVNYCCDALRMIKGKK